MTLYFMVGLPGSGKTTYAKRLAKENNAVRFSSDDIREEIGADGGDQSKHKEVFNILHKRLNDALTNSKDCIYDATNINAKKRAAFVREFKKKFPDCEFVCIVMATPIEYCKRFNFARDRKVPIDVIDRMYNNWQTPYYNEGWDKILLHYELPEFIGCNGTPNDFCNTFYCWDQENPHHKFSLGIHSLLVGNSMFNKGVTLKVAGLLHDCGKPYVKSKDDKGIAHYYDHHNVGAYESMFYDFSEYKDIDPIYVSFLINHHMDFYFCKNSAEGRAKFEKIYGADEMADVKTLFNHDKEYH